uniref:Uncharacterized protein n=1 Tax=Meloidogyne incognita TaxID=6306 RepID=A0A914N4V3_MELIC
MMNEFNFFNYCLGINSTNIPISSVLSSLKLITSQNFKAYSPLKIRNKDSVS